MNKQRRDKLTEIAGKISELICELEAVRDDEQEAYDNMPESFQNGERGEKSQAAIDAMEEVISTMEDAERAIETAQE